MGHVHVNISTSCVTVVFTLQVNVAPSRDNNDECGTSSVFTQIADHITTRRTVGKINQFTR